MRPEAGSPFRPCEEVVERVPTKQSPAACEIASLVENGLARSQ